MDVYLACVMQAVVLRLIVPVRLSSWVCTTARAGRGRGLHDIPHAYS